MDDLTSRSIKIRPFHVGADASRLSPTSAASPGFGAGCVRSDAPARSLSLLGANLEHRET
jgi:hypothetical protein